MENKSINCSYLSLLIAISLFGNYIYCSYPGRYCNDYQAYLSRNSDVVQQDYSVLFQRNYIIDGITSTASATPMAIPVEISNIF